MTRSLPIEQVIMQSDFSAAIAINATANVYSHSISLGMGISFSLVFIATSDGDVDLDVYVEEGAAPPTTEGSADDAWVQPENSSKLMTIDDETIHRIAYSPVVGRYMRLYIDGQGTNDATTTLSAKLVIIEDT